MSFILDALRKSEHERQRSAVPGLSHVPHSAPRRELPTWALAVMGALCVALVVLAAAWWQTSRARLEAPAVARVEQRPAALPAPSPATSTQVPSAAPSTTRATSAQPGQTLSAAAAIATDATGDRPTSTVPAAATSPPSTPSSATPAPASTAPTLPSAAALRAEGISLPELHLELHAFSATPTERFVFINGRKYVEGERLADGPDLVSIAPNGAVLNQQGRRFLLAPE